MLQSSEDAPRVLAQGQSLLGPGWKAVDSFDDLDEPDNFEDSDEVGQPNGSCQHAERCTGDVCGDRSRSSTRQSCPPNRNAIPAHGVTEFVEIFETRH